MNIVRSNNMETNTFFGALLVNRIGINLLPISPISEFVISPAWAKVHADTLRGLVDRDTEQFDAIIDTPPNENAPCFTAGWSPPGPHVDKKTGEIIYPNAGATCAGRLRVLYSWRQISVAALGITDPAGTYQKYVRYMDALENQQKTYTLNTRSSVYPDSSRNPDGVTADVLKDNSVPSTDTNTLWWLATRKPG
jgi:hypothetical protein